MSESARKLIFRKWIYNFFFFFFISRSDDVCFCLCLSSARRTDNNTQVNVERANINIYKICSQRMALEKDLCCNKNWITQQINQTSPTDKKPNFDLFS